eukprot:10705842-Karenia_brevis.AAC.1
MLLGPSYDHVEAELRSKYPSWAKLGQVGPNWTQVGPSWAKLGPSWTKLGPSWDQVAANWDQVGQVGTKLGPN